MKGDRYFLRRNDGTIVGIFEVDSDDYHSVIGKCYEPYSWFTDVDLPCESHFFANVYCKWDSCTHWNFYGENYDPELEETSPGLDSYYHICGEHCLHNHVRLMCFIWKLVSDIMTINRRKAGSDFSDFSDVTEEYFGCPLTKDLCELMLRGHDIEKVDVNGKRVFE